MGILFKNSGLTKTGIVVFFCSFFVISAIFFFSPDKDAINEKKFVDSLHLSFTLRVKEVLPTNSDRFYVLVGDVIRSNKPTDYEVSFRNTLGDEYRYCAFDSTKGLIVFHCMEPSRNPEIKLNDSLVVNTDKDIYWLFRDGRLKESYPVSVASSGTFSNSLTYDLSSSHYWK